MYFLSELIVIKSTNHHIVNYHYSLSYFFKSSALLVVCQNYPKTQAMSIPSKPSLNQQSQSASGVKQSTFSKSNEILQK